MDCVTYGFYVASTALIVTFATGHYPKLPNTKVIRHSGRYPLSFEEAQERAEQYCAAPKCASKSAAGCRGGEYLAGTWMGSASSRARVRFETEPLVSRRMVGFMLVNAR
jgi:hypothetical protein